MPLGSRERNFKRTALTQVDLGQFAGSLTTAEQQRLADLRGAVRLGLGCPHPGAPRRYSRDEPKAIRSGLFRHRGPVHHVATVMAVVRNLAFDRALWDASEFPSSGFVLHPLQAADRIRRQGRDQPAARLPARLPLAGQSPDHGGGQPQAR